MLTPRNRRRVPAPSLSTALALSAALTLAAGCSAPPAPPPSAPVVRMAGSVADVRVGLWVGAPDGTPHCALAADVPLACASSIKTAYLVELFAAHANALDAPLPGGVDIAADADHPAIAHFDAAVRADVRAQLGTASVREVGWAMVRSVRGPDGVRVTNPVYNAAANLTTAVLGGPAGMTAAIHARGYAGDGLRARRYMLAARDVTGDNTATPAALAAVLCALASGDVPGLDAATTAAVRAAMWSEQHPNWGAHFQKTGALNSDPQCRVLSGWCERDGRTVVYAIMAERTRPAVDVDEQGTHLAELAGMLRELLLAEAFSG